MAAVRYRYRAGSPRRVSRRAARGVWARDLAALSAAGTNQDAPLIDRVSFDAALGDAFRQIAFEGADPNTALATAADKLASVR